VTRRERSSRFLHAATVTTAFVLSLVTTLAWAWTGGVEQMGLTLGTGDPTVHGPAVSWTSSPDAPGTPGARPEPGVPARPGRPATSPTASAAPSGPAAPSTAATPRGGVRQPATSCTTGAKLVPTCGILWGVAPGAFTAQRGAVALAAFEKKTGRHQAIFHAYHRGTNQVFPTKAEIAIARQPGRERILFLNWKPAGASWAEIARGDKKTDAFLDRLAAHINRSYTDEFFLAVHHEAEDNVRPKKGSGYTARDYAAMFRYVIERLRARGADNVVSVLVHMAYVPHTSQSWFRDMYPGDDVVDWIGFDTYAYSDPGYGHGDFAELLNRRMESRPAWPGFYNYAVGRHANKPLMVAEWGVWSSKRNPGHKPAFYREIGRQLSRFPNVRAMVYFDTPHNQDGRDSRVDATPESLEAYRRLGRLPIFQVRVTHGLS
jgi:hypothetical protein